MSATPRTARAAQALALACAAAWAAAAGADWLQPDPSYREAQFLLRAAVRDTAGRGHDPAALDTLGVALLRLGRSADAEAVFRRALAARPGDATARAGLGKLALFAGREAEAESLLAGLAAEPGALADLFAARLRRGDWTGAAALAPEVEQHGRVAMLERLAAEPPYAIVAGPEISEALWTRAFPTPLVRVRLDGESVLMAVDTGASDLLVDESAARRIGIAPVGGEWSTFWNGTRHAVRGALVRRLEIAGFRIERLPAGVLPLRRWSILVHPQGEPVAGVIGLNLLRRFTPTLDYRRNRLVLRRPGAPWSPPADDARVPFELWGEAELMTHGTLAGGRRMAFIVQTGFPGCGIAAPSEVLDEIGVRPGGIAKLVKSAGQMVQGRPWTEVTVPSVAVGAVTRDKVTGWSGALDAAELWRHGVRRDAVLAGQFFRGRALTIDWARRELRISAAK